MNQLRTATAALASAFALTVLAAPVAAQAAGSETEPCAQQQAQLDRANAALDRVSAVFAKQQERVADAKEDVAQADTHAAKGQARAELAKAKAKKEHVVEAKKAQQQRVAKATARLDKCQAAQDDTTPTTPTA